MVVGVDHGRADPSRELFLDIHNQSGTEARNLIMVCKAVVRMKHQICQSGSRDPSAQELAPQDSVVACAVDLQGCMLIKHFVKHRNRRPDLISSFS
ncbi:hypothetical protein OPV22_004396 [Ensete ventricosum]|uniref:Uncharacterized protein n=1 Tax=Ensete ventricosum TaxID=4639 RepID=A0AAV8S3A0_ENSVE|nr:hypothetical protein OPV22_004396 [Ensete ventricosum]